MKTITTIPTKKVMLYEFDINLYFKGTSDPYVKFKFCNRVVYKSRIVSKCLDPKWDEYFIIPIDDVFQQISVKAYDHDFGFQDDFLGAASIDLTKLDIGM